MTDRRKIDTNELYDKLKELSDTYIICADLCNLKNTNDTYGYAAGDLLIAEAARRIDHEISKDMFMFRIGGDEFAVITGYKTLNETELLAKKIIKLNGTPISLADEERVPLSLRIGITKIPSCGLNYKEAIDDMLMAIDNAKDEDIYIYTQHRA